MCRVHDLIPFLRRLVFFEVQGAIDHHCVHLEAFSFFVYSSHELRCHTSPGDEGCRLQEIRQCFFGCWLAETSEETA